MLPARETTLTFFFIYCLPRSCPRFTFWLTFFQSVILPLLLSYLVRMKRRTSRCVQTRQLILSCYLLNSPETKSCAGHNSHTVRAI